MAYMNSRIKPQQNDWDTNTGWWADKPARDERPSQLASLDASSAHYPRVWRDALLIVSIMFALLLSLISLATR